jgi:KDO2-lipid IV(A) lauroyltransferase
VADRCCARDHAGREAVLSNLRQVFAWRGLDPAQDVLEGTARKTYQYFGKNLVDFFRYSGISDRDLERWVSFENLHHLEASYAEGKGVIVLSAHFGCWEMGGGILTSLGYPLNVVALPQRLEKLNKLFLKQRSRYGMKILQLGHSPRQLLKCLERGELVALLGDRDFSGHGVSTELFGRKVLLPRGPAWLAVRTGAPILPVFVTRQVDDSLLMRVHDPIRPGPADGEADLQPRICEVLEQEISAQPHQWFVFEDFWATYGGAPAT